MAVEILPIFFSGGCNGQQELPFLKKPKPFVPEKNF